MSRRIEMFRSNRPLKRKDERSEKGESVVGELVGWMQYLVLR